MEAEDPKNTDLSPEAVASVMRQAAGKQSPLKMKGSGRGLSGMVAGYVKKLKRRLSPAEVKAETAARQRSEELRRRFEKAGRQRARKEAVDRELAAVSSGPGKLDVPRKARQKIARAKAKRSAK